MIVNGATLVPDVSGALWWVGERLLAVADLHLGKGSAFARHGSLLPPYDSHATIVRLEEAITRLEPSTVVCLGDSFHDDGAASRLDAPCRMLLRTLVDGRNWVWVSGNHDPRPPRAFSGLGVREFAAGPLTFRHEPSPGAVVGEVCGHFHPSAVVSARGLRLRRRCFASDGRRTILPAFGAYAGGLDIHEEAISCLFPKGFGVWIIGRDRVRRVDRRSLIRPRRIGHHENVGHSATAAIGQDQGILSKTREDRGNFRLRGEVET